MHCIVLYVDKSRTVLTNRNKLELFGHFSVMTNNIKYLNNMDNKYNLYLYLWFYDSPNLDLDIHSVISWAFKNIKMFDRSTPNKLKYLLPVSCPLSPYSISPALKFLLPTPCSDRLLERKDWLENRWPFQLFSILNSFFRLGLCNLFGPIKKYFANNKSAHLF